MINDKNYIWIFGENLGSTANNNSFYFWKHIVNIKDEIEKYIVFEKNESTLKVYETLSKYEKKFVLWKNSKKHYQKYFDADLFFVTLSYKDITPNKLLIKNMNMVLKKPLIYLQHGTIGMKQVYYEGNTYWNNMFRFFIYTDDEFEYLKKYNDFADYQLYNARYHPRYGELLRKDEKYDKNQILWFITWREYFGQNSETELFIKNIETVVKSEKLREHLKKENLTLKICLHQFFDENSLRSITKYLENGLIEIAHPGKVDVMDELAKSKLLITDYSSVAYDFTFLNRPVMLFQPDIPKYIEEREFYCSLETLEKINIENPMELIDTLISKDYKINPFFKKAFPEKIDYNNIKENKHIDNIYSHFKDIQLNKITIMGMNFFNANEITCKTLNLAENLMKRGFLVNLISLKQPRNIKLEFPYGLNVTGLNIEDDPSMRTELKKQLHKSASNYFYLELDSEKEKIHPYTGYYLKKLMKNIKTKTLISTRESLHLFLNDCKSPHVKTKLYIRNPHEYFSGKSHELAEEIKKFNFENIFLSNQDKTKLEELFNIKLSSDTILENSYITDNQIAGLIDLNSDLLDENGRPIHIDEEVLENNKKLIKEYELLNNSYISPKKRYVGITFIDFNDENSNEISEIISFGNYLKENNITNTRLDVCGDGDYTDKFLDLIEENDLFGYVRFRGLDYNPATYFRLHDFVLNLSETHLSTCELLGIVNYKPVFTMSESENTKTDLITSIPFNSFEELCDKINSLADISLEELLEPYLKIYDKINDDEAIDEFLKLIE